jgi:PPK2 family polyphosphate:nucleotide phosphotransferase
MAGLNPTGIDVISFKQPTSEELDHDYLWRCEKRLPARGRIGIFNRSHYEEVIITRVHPELLLQENLPSGAAEDKDIWKCRYNEIRDWEKYLRRNGVWVVKFFLHISKDEQKKNLLERINEPEKNWKVAKSDFFERRYWDDYQDAYEQALRNTSTEEAPWYVIPSDKKWFARAAVASILVDTLNRMNPQYPEVDEEKRKELAELKEMLENE